MAASSSMIHSAHVSSSGSCKYDIFLSFRGEDTRKTFVDHLYTALERHSITVYKDDEKLPRGESIGPSLFNAIEESRIAIIVFSKHYADSSWCLDELAHIMKCREERELIVMPVFYDVDPSDVRKQKGDFGIIFLQQEVLNIDKVKLWRNALVDASNIAGWEPKHIANGHESKVITEIIESAMSRLFPLNTDVDDGLVGMTTRLQYLKSQLDIGSGGVRMVGIWGCGGSGKTTLATAVYMEICSQFQGHCIVENIREESRNNKLKKLQKTMLSAVFNKEVYVSGVEEGKRKIKSMLCSRNVLIILDDVNDLDQLDALAGSHSWFGNGSRIIITTRDEHLLRTHKVDEVCQVRLLSNDDAMQLFNQHAYNEKIHIEDYETLSLSVVSYAAGLPLALKVLGSFLYDKEKDGWKSTLDRLIDIPETEIVEKLKLSYDGLKVVEKELFLDIACFFRGHTKDATIEILEACDFHPEIGIQVLRQKALISIVDGRFDMHDLIQEMGHYIVRGEHPHNPDKHSRIWKQEEINNMCLGAATSVNEKIEAIRYHDHEVSHGYDHALQLYKNVSNIKKLRYLSVWMSDPEDVELEGPTFLSNELRFIDWKGYPPTSPLPNSFQPTRLVVLKLEYSFQKDVWMGRKHLPHLKVLELYKTWKLLRTPDFSGLPCLQKLTISSCLELKEIHPSLENCTNLQYVKVSYCPKVRMFPKLVHLKNLKSLEILDCDKILEFPKIQANMDGLVNLSMVSGEVEVLPSSISEHCTNLIFLQLSNFPKLKSIDVNFDALKRLKKLRLEASIGRVKKSDLYAIPSSIIELSNLQTLNLTRHHFSRLDFSLSQLTSLKFLDLSVCRNLRELPELPSSLAFLIADNCESLTTVGDCYKNCRWLCQVSLEGGGIIIDGHKLLEFMLEVCIENHYMFLRFGGVEIAKWFSPPLRSGSGCTLQLPENWCNDFSGFLMCVAMPDEDFDIDIRICVDETNGVDSQHDLFWKESDSSRSYQNTWMAYVSFDSLRQTVWWDETYKALSFDAYDECSGFGVKLIDKKNTSSRNETPANYSSGYIPPNLVIQHDSNSFLVMSFSTITKEIRELCISD